MNKTFKLYGIIFLVVLVILGLLEINKTEVTDWRKNLSVNEKTPFGLWIFNKEADALFGRKVSREAFSPFEYFRKNSGKSKNYLLVESQTDSESWKKILGEVSEGSDVLVFSEFFSDALEDTLRFSSTFGNFDETARLSLTDKKFAADSLLIDKLPSRQVFTEIRPEHEVLGKTKGADNKEKAVFIKIKVGKGNVYLHSEPLVLTNYYLLKKGNENYVQDVFSYLPERETVWFSGENQVESSSPMRFILSQPALKYSWWLLLGGLLLFVIFNAKRKQRIVPIIEPVKNKSVEFVKSIGNLYLQEGDFHDMMDKKAQYFMNRVRLELMIDTQNLDKKFAEKLSVKTGKSPEKINEAIALIKKATDPYAAVMQEDLARMNQLLDEILR